MGEGNRVSLYTRRDFGKLALSAVPAAGLAGSLGSAFAFQAKPNSLWGGVPFGIFAPYRFGPEASDLQGALNALVKFGVSYTELSNAVVERYAGAPQAPARAGGAGAAAAGAGAAAATPAAPARGAAGAGAAAAAPAPGAIPCQNGVPVARAGGAGN